MKKMTKLAVTVAAMSAMTIAAATMVSADGKYNSIANEKPATGISDGEWAEDANKDWTFTVDDKKVTGWNEIDGVWYYFHKDYIMAKDELVYLSGHTYYFNSNGSMMANGWVGFDQDSETLYDYELDVQDNIYDINNPVFTKPEDTYDTVWMYFNSNGTAKDDEWFQAASGLWYYFDDIIMACGDFDHEIGNSVYGFDENGAMLVGWNQNYNDKGLLAPNEDDKAWYWYDSNGKKFDVSNESNHFGWKKIGNEWYCFYAQEAAANTKNYSSVGTMVSNTYFSNRSATGYEDEYYYVTKDGAMATGVVIVDKDAYYVNAENLWDAKSKVKDYTGDGTSWEVFFDKTSGKAKGNAWSGDRFYAAKDSDKVIRYDDSDYTLSTYATSGYAKVDDQAADLKGALVKKAFINKDGNTYYVDKYGDKVTSSGVQVGYVAVAQELDPEGKSIDKYKVLDFELDDSNINLASLTPSAGYAVPVIYRAYVVLDGKGLAYDDVDTDRTVSAGSKKYISTGKGYDAIDTNVTAGVKDATVFFYKNRN